MDYELTDPIWFSDDRMKTTAAMKTLYERVPADVLEDLNVLFFAPSQDVYGQVYPARFQAEALIYLSPILEQQPQEEVDFTVAHEVAHVYLRHKVSLISNFEEARKAAQAAEEEADVLVARWGFKIPERRK